MRHTDEVFSSTELPAPKPLALSANQKKKQKQKAKKKALQAASKIVADKPVDSGVAAQASGRLDEKHKPKTFSGGDTSPLSATVAKPTPGSPYQAPPVPIAASQGLAPESQLKKSASSASSKDPRQSSYPSDSSLSPASASRLKRSAITPGASPYKEAASVVPPKDEKQKSRRRKPVASQPSATSFFFQPPGGPGVNVAVSGESQSASSSSMAAPFTPAL